MKYTDLTPEQRKHFNSVIDYYGNTYREDFPEDATHVDFDGDPDTEYVLLKETSEGAFFYNSYTGEWERDTYPAENYYQIPDKPWYDPAEVGFSKEVSDAHKKRVNELTLQAMQEPLEDCETLDSIDELFEKPTGGKSSYYLIEIPFEAPSLEIDTEKGVVRFMLEEYIKYGLGNDFDRGNISKANHRLGNKLGVDVDYDLNKIEHHTKRIRKINGGE